MGPQPGTNTELSGKVTKLRVKCGEKRELENRGREVMVEPRPSSVVVKPATHRVGRRSSCWDSSVGI